jgi:hypothetical protein
MNIVILYYKDKLMDKLKEDYHMKRSDYKYGKDTYSITIKQGMTGYVMHRAIVWDLGINFLEYERRLKTANVDYELKGNFYRYDFKKYEDIEKAINILYDTLFEYLYIKDKGAAVDEYSREIQ